MVGRILISGAVLLAAVTAWAGEIDTKQQEMLFPVVRVTVSGSGGSGTILFSEDRGDGCQTYVLTNHHVVAGAIKVKEEWSSLLQSDVKRESNDPVKVEVFRYADGSRQDVSDTYRGDLVAHHHRHDLALVKLSTTRKLDHVATLLPAEGKVAIFEQIWAVGCSLLHPPVVTEGIIDYLDDVIDRKIYWLGSASIIYGNSGGAVFIERDGHYRFIGVPSRVAVTWNQAVTHMGYFVPVTRVREWLADEKLAFLFDGKSTPTACFEQRKKLREQAELQLFRKGTPNGSSAGDRTPTPSPAP